MPSDNRYLHSSRITWLLTAVCMLSSACAGPTNVSFSPGHLAADKPAVEITPAAAVVIPKPDPEPVRQPVMPSYTVVVKAVPVVDLLFSIARDAGLDLDIQAASDKLVTINAVDRPLREILSRISEQVNLRFQMRGNNLVIQDDTPYWHNYLVDYVNISRSSEGEVGVATQIATSGGTVGEDSGSQGDQQGNLSKTVVKSTSNNDFWRSLEEGLEAIVKNVRASGASVSPMENDSVIVNRMSGVVTVLGTQKQQQRVQQHLDNIVANSQRQVLIEMTIVEVELSDNYQAGVDWQRLSNDGGAGNNGASLQSSMLGANLRVPPFFTLGYSDTDADGSSISATVSMLQEFGDTKVLSSPKIMALNNQTALLKVVNENVFFTVELDIREATTDIPERRTFTSVIHTVPVGLVLSVTPQISAKGLISLHIRPTISRITGFAVDPAPRLAGAEFDNLIPEIQVREIESLLQVQDGRTVVLGGLMQNEHRSEKSGIPGLSRIPKVGKLFSYSKDSLVKTELVIFLKPTIVASGTPLPGAARVSDYYDRPLTESVSKIEYR